MTRKTLGLRPCVPMVLEGSYLLQVENKLPQIPGTDFDYVRGIFNRFKELLKLVE